MRHPRPVGVAQKLIAHVVRGLKHANPCYVGAGIRRETRAQTTQWLQPAQTLACDLGVHHLWQFMRQEQATAQEIGASPGVRIFEKAERLWPCP